jgi:hypothetical protein
VRLAVRCLERFGDGVLLHDGDGIALLRLGGRTVPNTLWDWGEPPGLAAVEAELTWPRAETS